MNKTRKFSALCVVVMLLLSFSACDTHELPPYIANPETTTAATAVVTTTVATTTSTTTTAKSTATRTPPTTTKAPTTTTTQYIPSGPPEPPDPDPQITFEEYVADGWYGGEHAVIREMYPDAIGHRNWHSGGYIAVYGEPFLPVDYLGEDVIATMQKGALYSVYENTVTLLRTDGLDHPTSTCYHLGYAYLAFDDTIYRYRQTDGAEETVIHKANGRVYALTADRYAVYFMQADGLYQLFRPTGQLRRLVETDGTQCTSLARFSEDLLGYNDRVYSLTNDREFNWNDLLQTYKDETGFVPMEGSWYFYEGAEFAAWLKEYCENNPE